MWCWRSMQTIGWPDHVKNKVVYRIKEERNILHIIKKRLTELVKSCIGIAL